VIALVWANLAHASYARVAAALAFPVNDIGMAFFFALATKEVVEATAPGGALHTWRRAALPVIAAAGGMAVPSAIYVMYVIAAVLTAALTIAVYSLRRVRTMEADLPDNAARRRIHI